MTSPSSQECLPAEARREQGLVSRARAGDAEAFRELVERYEGLVAATVMGMLGQGPEAEDVGQSVFIKLYESLDQYRGEGGLAPYVTRIAINLSLNAADRRRRRRRRFVPADDETMAKVHVPADVERWEREDLLYDALMKLPEPQRVVVVLRMIRGCSTRETADLLDLPLGTVLSRLSRAQERLRKLLEPYLSDYHE